MRSILLTLAVLITFSLNSFSQNAFYNAKYLQDHGAFIDTITRFHLVTLYAPKNYDVRSISKDSNFVVLRAIMAVDSSLPSCDNAYNEKAAENELTLLAHVRGIHNEAMKQYIMMQLEKKDAALALVVKDRFPHFGRSNLYFQEVLEFIQETKYIDLDLDANSPAFRNFVQTTARFNGLGEKGMPENLAFTALNFSTASKGITQVAQGADLTTQLIEATSEFLVERTKEELALAFFNKFRDKLNESPEFKILFPATSTLAIYSDPNTVPLYGPTWEIAFKSDLGGLLENAQRLPDVDSSYNFIKENNQLRVAFAFARCVQLQQSGTHPKEILFELDSDIGANSNTDPNTHNIDPALSIFTGVRLANTISQSLTSKDRGSDHPWIDKNDFAELSAEGAIYYTRFLYYSNPAVFDSTYIYPTVRLSSALFKRDSIGYYSKHFINTVNSFIVITERVRELKEEADLATNDSLKKIVAFKYVIIIGDLIDFGAQTLYFHKRLEYNSSPYYTNYKPLISIAINVSTSLQSRNYSQVLLGVAQLLEPVMNECMTKKLTDTTSINHAIRLRSLLTGLLYYGNFMIDVVNADSVESKKEVLKKYAAPVGSFQVKRKNHFSVSINAYPGLYGGLERNQKNYNLTNADSLSNFRSDGLAWGVTAPIGLNISWAINSEKSTKDRFGYGKVVSKTCKRKIKSPTGHSFSFFVPIVDIGATFAYKFSEKSKDDAFPDKIRFDQILSPGLYMSWGLKNTPLALNAGWQFTPSLRKVQEGNASYYANAHRFSIGIHVDIPIFSLYAKPIKIKKSNK